MRVGPEREDGGGLGGFGARLREDHRGEARVEDGVEVLGDRVEAD